MIAFNAQQQFSKEHAAKLTINQVERDKKKRQLFYFEDELGAEDVPEGSFYKGKNHCGHRENI